MLPSPMQQQLACCQQPHLATAPHPEARAADDAPLPAPVFEGSEKRVELDFALGAAPASGLRAIPRAQLDELMSLAACTIVSSRSNAHFDAYVLSESSLFVYPTKWVLKTCGTTKLLRSVPRLLQLAVAGGLQPARCKYNRASFLFPEQQVCCVVLCCVRQIEHVSDHACDCSVLCLRSIAAVALQQWHVCLG